MSRLLSSTNAALAQRFTWDAENRLVGFEPVDPNLPGAHKVAFKYDYLGRRVEKTVYNWSGGAWQAADVRRFMYHGWLLLMELDPNNNVVRRYTWGLDLAGQNGSINSLESAGGIGGLLAVSDPNDPNDPNDPCGDFVYFYDGNGNVGQVVDLAHDANDPAGAIVAKYEYDPYGRRINHDPNVPEYDQPWRFSTKQFDAETGLGYWGYRYYSPGLGRWISRDPIGELSDSHLYVYVHNLPVSLVDTDGRWYFGIGLGAGGTIMLSGGPSTGLPGLSLSYSEVLILPKCTICATGAVTVIPGLGVNISVGAGPVVTVGPGAQPQEGPGVTLGVGGSFPWNPATMTGLEITADVDIQSGQVTVTIPRLSAGLTAYVGFRVSGTCTGCSRFSSSARYAKLLNCLQGVAGAYGQALQKLQGLVIPANQATTVTFNVGPISPDELPPKKCDDNARAGSSHE